MANPTPLPRVTARLLVENRDRLVSKDEIVERVWDGRPVSDAAIFRVSLRMMFQVEAVPVPPGSTIG